MSGHFGTPWGAKLSSLSASAWWAIASIAAMLIGSFGPWGKALGFITVNGLDTDDGKVIVALAIVSAVVLAAVLANDRRWPYGVLIAIGIGGIVVTVDDLNKINKQTEAVFGLKVTEIVDPGWGLWLSMGGCISLALASAWLMLTPARADASAD